MTIGGRPDGAQNGRWVDHWQRGAQADDEVHTGTKYLDTAGHMEDWQDMVLG